MFQSSSHTLDVVTPMIANSHGRILCPLSLQMQMKMLDRKNAWNMDVLKATWDVSKTPLRIYPCILLHIEVSFPSFQAYLSISTQFLTVCSCPQNFDFGFYGFNVSSPVKVSCSEPFCNKGNLPLSTSTLPIYFNIKKKRRSRSKYLLHRYFINLF